MLKQNEGTLTDHETGKAMPTQGNKPSAGYVGSLSLGKDMFQAQGPFLDGKVGIKRLFP